ncbi:MAG TPA: nicotinate-nucleotide--dimethylbenzimidazole phosphoribosyltransferase [Alphaproteobacteria bacterium]|jgi:nicotinate-nucleotide--dimethylbenzimidazole phosphoribosyltransferase|nr:nicotinate-nucleotide--dimethylbenzimidazole phosphoribosyltransferase [Alphaproteobacteria bacterium]
MPTPAASFDEIRAVAQLLPFLAGTGGDLETWVRAVQDKPEAGITHPRIVVFAATHGIAVDLLGGDGAGMAQIVEQFVSGGPVQDLAGAADSDLRLYDLALDRPTRDSRSAPAMDEAEVCRAAAYGMMAVEPGIDVLVCSALGHGADLAGRALVQALSGDEIGLESSGDGVRIAAAVARHGLLDDPLQLLAALGGPDIAALLGLILAARLARIPVVLDGAAAEAAAFVARALRTDALDHCRFSAGTAPAILATEADPPVTGVQALLGLKTLYPG